MLSPGVQEDGGAGAGGAAGSAALGRRLFSFAVLSDSHVNEADDRSVSPYRSNRLANGRLRHAVQRINAIGPAFTVHLGDMGNPLPELATYDAAAVRFREIADGLAAPLHLVPGNHCVGDKPAGWVPVPRVSEPALARYERCYQSRPYYGFDHDRCHFAVLNSLLPGSGLALEEAQRDWLEADLARASADGRRRFVLMHYPAFVTAAEEPDGYDNLDRPQRAWLLDLLARHGVEAAFSGHVHNYFYNRWQATALYTVPSTSFVRQDYAELYAVAPADEEGGRNDSGKLGLCVVEIFERGHRCRLVRTGGAWLPAGERAAPRALTRHAASDARGELGVEMRDHWLSRVWLRPNNSVSPFSGRWARNDWAVAALEEAGIRRVRLPLEELAEPGVPERLAALGGLGFEFIAYSFGDPTDAEAGLVERHRGLLSGWELIATREEVEAAAARLAPAPGAPAEEPGPACYWSEARGVSRDQIDDANVKHVANYGFQVEDLERVEGLWPGLTAPGHCGGPVYRLRRRGGPEVGLWESVRAIDEQAGRLGTRSQVHLLFSGNVTAERFENDVATAGRVAEGALAAAACGRVDVYFDTFADVDRGYFLRHGLVDRRYNPRLAARVLRHLREALAGLDVGPGWLFEHRELAGGRQIGGRREEVRLALVLPAPGCVWRPPAAGSGAGWRWIDLESGEEREPARGVAGGDRREPGGRSIDRPALMVSAPP